MSYQQPPETSLTPLGGNPDVELDVQLKAAVQVTDLALYKRVLKYALPYWPIFVLSLVGFLAGNAAEIQLARILADFMENWGKPSEFTGQMLVLTVLGVALVRGLGAVIGEVFLSRVSFRVVHDVRCELFNGLLYKPAAFFDKATSGKLVSIFSFSVLQLRDTATDALKTIIQDGTKVIFLLGAMIYTSWILSLAFLIALPCVAGIAAFASSRFRRVSTRIQQSMGEVTHIASEAIQAQAVVRAFDGYKFESDRFNDASETNRRRQVRLAMTKAASVQLIQFIVALALAGLMYLLLIPELGESLSSGDVLFFLSMAGLLAKPIKKLSEVNARLQRGLAAAEEVFGTLDAANERNTGTLNAAGVRGQIEFSEVVFNYEGVEESTLKGVSFAVNPGETLAIVGRTGSGKSTILKLIPRLYELTDGKVLLDGKQIDEYELKSLREQVSVVDQNVQLFDCSIRENIAYGSLTGASDEEIEAAVAKSGLAEFVATLPDGLQTQVGDRGTRLSGGQRQRISLARALLKDRPILLLDEATSALDPETERSVQQALADSSADRTVLVVAHRLDTVKKADRILVLDAGQIIESGSHEELLAKNGAYAKLSQHELLPEV